MQFVGGYPNEYCIYLKNLSQEELQMITDIDGNIINIDEEISKMA